MFAYCENNPINYGDYTGESKEAILALVVLDPTLLGELILAGVLIVVAGIVIIESLDAIINYLEEKAEDTNEKAEDPPQSLDGDEKNNESEDKRKLPMEGDPNSDQHLYDEAGLKQTRHYGPDGKAEYDIDYHHPGNHEFPHMHIWDWSTNPPTRILIYP